MAGILTRYFQGDQLLSGDSFFQGGQLHSGGTASSRGDNFFGGAASFRGDSFFQGVATFRETAFDSLLKVQNWRSTFYNLLLHTTVTHGPYTGETAVGGALLELDSPRPPA